MSTSKRARSFVALAIAVAAAAGLGLNAATSSFAADGGSANTDTPVYTVTGTAPDGTDGTFTSAITNPETATAAQVAGDTSSSVTGSSTTSTTGIYSDHAVTASLSKGGSISQSQVLARAQSWVDEGVNYNQQGYHTDANGTYRKDCSGFVSMAWNLPYSRTTWTLDDSSITTHITQSQLQPGDALDYDADHVILFAGWKDQSAGTFNYYAESNPSVLTNEYTGSFNNAKIAGWPVSDYTFLRYNNITNGGAISNITKTAAVGDTGRTTQILNSDGRLSTYILQSNNGIMGADESSTSSGSFGSLVTYANPATSSSATTVLNADDKVELFTLQTDGGVATRLETSAGSHTFGGWNHPAGANAASQVVVARHTDGRLEMIVVQTNGGLASRMETSPGSDSWGSWRFLAGASSIERVALGTEADGRIHLFAVQTNGGIADMTETSPGSGQWGAFNNFAPAGTMSTTAPKAGGADIAIGHFQNSALIVGIVKADGTVSTKYQTAANGGWATTWGDQTASGAAQSLAITTHRDGKLDLLVTQTNGGLARMIESSANGGWSGTWDVILPANDIVAVNPILENDGWIDLFAVQTDGAIMHSVETTGDGFAGSWLSVAPKGEVSVN